MSQARILLLLAVAAVCMPLLAQPVGAPASASGSAPFSATVRPALAQVGEALNGINIRKWKAPNDVRSAAQRDADSIQQDMNGTLAGLMQQSDAAPASLPAAFAVYRNVDALYDTLLRVVETGGLAAPDREVATLDAALSQLEQARSSLGDAILGGIQTQQADLMKLRAAIAAAAAAPRTTKTTVVDDGPEAAAAHHRRTTKKHTPTSKEKPRETPQSQTAPH